MSFPGVVFSEPANVTVMLDVHFLAHSFKVKASKQHRLMADVAGQAAIVIIGFSV